MSRFVRPETQTLTLANGDTLLVKCLLNAAEARYMKAMEAVPSVAIVAVVMVYLVDWSLVGLDDQPTPIKGLSPSELASTLDSLGEYEFDEIRAAIVTHRDAMAAERAKKKITRTGEPSLSPISSSPSVQDSPSMKFAHST